MLTATGPFVMRTAILPPNQKGASRPLSVVVRHYTITERSDRLPYARLHRDPDFNSLRGYPPFVALITPK